MPDQGRKRGTAAIVTKYLVAILASLFLPAFLAQAGPPFSVISSLVSLAFFPLIVGLAGSMVEQYGHPGVGKTIKYAAGGGLYALMAGPVFGILSDRYVVLVPTVFGTVFSFFLFFAFTSRLGKTLCLYDTMLRSGSIVKDLSEAAMVISLAFIFGMLPYVWFFFYPLLFVGITLAFLSPKVPFLKSGKRDLNAMGRYMVLSGNRWIFSSFLMGVLVSLLFVPAAGPYSQYIMILIFLILILAVGRALLKTYKMQSAQVERYALNVYSSHKHDLVLTADPLIDSLNNTVREFTVNGEKEKLIILFTVLLIGTGAEYDEIGSVLDPIISYRVPDIIYYPPLRTRERLEREAEKRMSAVNSVVRTIYARTGAGVK